MITLVPGTDLIKHEVEADPSRGVLDIRGRWRCGRTPLEAASDDPDEGCDQVDSKVLRWKHRTSELTERPDTDLVISF